MTTGRAGSKIRALSPKKVEPPSSSLTLPNLTFLEAIYGEKNTQNQPIKAPNHLKSLKIGLKR
jgi:hypothetical protein